MSLIREDIKNEIITLLNDKKFKIETKHKDHIQKIRKFVEERDMPFDIDNYEQVVWYEDYFKDYNALHLAIQDIETKTKLIEYVKNYKK